VHPCYMTVMHFVPLVCLCITYEFVLYSNLLHSFIWKPFLIVGAAVIDRAIAVDCYKRLEGKSLGEFHDQADAEWIVINGPLRGHNDTSCGRPTPERPIARSGVERL